MKNDKMLSIYVKDSEAREKVNSFCQKNHITISEFTTLLYREFFDTNAMICISNDKFQIVRKG